MTLRLYNTRTRRKEPFRPLDWREGSGVAEQDRKVRMYVCGPTVYDFAHIGNARPVIVFDVLYRLLRHLYGGPHVKYVRNITDVDDKINTRAAEEYPDLPLNEAIGKVTKETERQFHEDVKALGCLPPDVEPRATQHIPQMKAMIERLIETGHAYVAADHVLFEVKKMPDYGKLSRRSVEEMQAGARVEVAPYKKDPMDFVLWKPSKEGEPAWDSPAGIAQPGRPGWHLECSAMSAEHLGRIFDIHGGGIDLVFPHHENEIAQSTCAHGTEIMAEVWMHNGYLQVEGEKMAKSLGNFITIRELLRGWSGKAWSGSAIRLAMLGSHYRKPLNWTEASLESAQEELEGWALNLSSLTHKSNFSYRNIEPNPSEEFLEALEDDLNTPAALTALRMQSNIASKGDIQAAEGLVGNLKFLQIIDFDRLGAYMRGVGASGGVTQQKLVENIELGETLKIAKLNNDLEFVEEITNQLRERNLRASVRRGRVQLTIIKLSQEKGEDQIAEMIKARNAARKAKNFAEADRIRDELSKMGVELHDTPEGTTWEVAR